MKSSAVKVIAAVFLTVGVFAAFIGWYPFVFSLGWPVWHWRVSGFHIPGLFRQS
jgi:hypothetical protein